MHFHTPEHNLRLIFAGGGTGGHIMPGAAVADALHRIDPTTRNLFLLTSRETERHCHSALANHQLTTIPTARWGGIRQKFHFTCAAMAAAARCLNIYRDFQPDVVVGLGGYSSVAPVLMARTLGRPVMIFESNAVPGRVTRLLSPIADCVQLQWADAAHQLKARRTVVTGNPIRRELLTTDRADAQQRLSLAPDRLTLLVMGGSQGARPLNKRLFAALRILGNQPTDILRKLQVIHLTGRDNLDSTLPEKWSSEIIYRPIGFTPHMEDIFAAADTVLCRAGGSTIAEITAMGLPAILVPYPHAKDDHQMANARCLERVQAARVIPQPQLTPERLAGLIERVIQQPRCLHHLAARAHQAGRPLAAHRVARIIRNMAGISTPSEQSHQKRLPDRTSPSLFTAA